jgi:hypothetical protein
MLRRASFMVIKAVETMTLPHSENAQTPQCNHSFTRKPEGGTGTLEGQIKGISKTGN